MTIFVLFFFALLIYIILVNTRNKYNYFFLAAVLSVIAYFWYTERLSSKKSNANMMAYIDQLEKQSAQRMIITSPLYYNYKTPMSFRYLRNFPNAVQWLYDMRYFNTYDKSATLLLASLLEKFFMIHYKVVMKQYDATTYMSNLVDIRNDVVNYMYAMIHEFPSQSMIVDKDMDGYHYNMLLRIQIMLTDHIAKLERFLRREDKYYINKDDWPKAYERHDHGTYDVL